MQDACYRCHGDQLETARDTHPATKFNDPTNAELLSILNAQDCLACHREHLPERTLEHGLTMPADYCWHCHEDVAESRPSHAGMAFDSCATAGCHNYHDNRALTEKYLNTHFGEPDFLSVATTPQRNFIAGFHEITSLGKRRFKSPTPMRRQASLTDSLASSKIVDDWADDSTRGGGRELPKAAMRAETTCGPIRSACRSASLATSDKRSRLSKANMECGWPWACRP